MTGMNSIEKRVSLISRALELDANGDSKGAFKDYLTSSIMLLNSIEQKWSEESGLQQLVDEGAVSSMRLVSQCVDRMNEILANTGSAGSSPENKPRPENKPQPTPRTSKSPQAAGGTVKPAAGTSPSIHLAPNASNASPQATVADQLSPHSQCSSAGGVRPASPETPLSPTDPLVIAQQQNLQLLRALQERIQHLAPHDSRRVAMSLSMQRKMAENVAIAHRKRPAYQRQVARSKQAMTEEAELRLVEVCRAQPTDEEQQAMVSMYTESRKLEASDEILRQLVISMRKHSGSHELAQALVVHILQTRNHPVTRKLTHTCTELNRHLDPLVQRIQRLTRYQRSQQETDGASMSEFIAELEKSCEDNNEQTVEDSITACRSQVAQAIRLTDNRPENLPNKAMKPDMDEDELNQELDELLEGDKDSGDELIPSNEQVQLDESLQEDCRRVLLWVSECVQQSWMTAVYVSAALYEPLTHSDLLDLTLTSSQHLLLASVVPKILTVLRYEKAASIRDWDLIRCEQEQNVNSVIRTASEILCQITHVATPNERLQCLVHSLHTLTDTKNDEENNETIVSADDVVQALCRLLLYADLPDFSAQLDLIALTTPDWLLLGEEGYCLTSFQTALAFLQHQSLNKNIRHETTL